MGYTAPTTRASGYLVTAANWNTDLVDNITFLANPPACRVTSSGTQSVGDASFLNPVLFDTESYDTDSMHSTSVNTGRITFNTAGVYVVSFNCRFTTASDYLYTQAQLLLNGAGHIGGSTVQGNSGTSYEPWLTVTAQHKFAAADYCVCSVFQDNSGAAARNLLAAASFSAVWVGLG